MKNIKISNSQNRDSEVQYGGVVTKSDIKYILPDGSSPLNVKMLKSSVDKQYEALLEKAGTDEALAELMIISDPEINFEATGMLYKGGQKVLIDKNNRPVNRVTAKEVVYLPDGTVKEEREIAHKQSNIVSEFPVRWTGKSLPIAEIYTKFIFGKTYQLTHNSGLTFDFLYGMAKELAEKKAMMLLGAGAKGNEPLVFMDNGKPFRAFLEGRIKGDSYLLLLHLSNLELKSIL
jgi:CBS domain-containing protein